MKAKDLIKVLQSVDPNTDVCMSDNGYVMDFTKATLGREISTPSYFISEDKIKGSNPKDFGLDEWPKEKIVLLY